MGFGVGAVFAEPALALPAGGLGVGVPLGTTPFAGRGCGQRITPLGSIEQPGGTTSAPSGQSRFD